MFSISFSHQLLSKEELTTKYCDVPRFLEFCKSCRNYGTRWSCPPLHIEASQYLAPYNRVWILGAQTIFTPQTILEADTPEKIKEVTRETLGPVKKALCETLLELEQKIPGSRSLFVGGCEHCTPCARTQNQPCLHPELMRYSLDALGFDLSALTSDLLGIELQWAKESLPPYYTLINGFLLPAKAMETKEELFGLFQKLLKNRLASI